MEKFKSTPKVFDDFVNIYKKFTTDRFLYLFTFCFIKIFFYKTVLKNFISIKKKPQFQCFFLMDINFKMFKKANSNNHILVQN